MKILHVTNWLPEGHAIAGGAEAVCLNTIRMAQRPDMNAVCFACRPIFPLRIRFLLLLRIQFLITFPSVFCSPSISSALYGGLWIVMLPPACDACCRPGGRILSIFINLSGWAIR